MKTCTKCKIEKELIFFSKNKNRIDNFEGQCKKCKKEYLKKYYTSNKEHIKENQKTYYLNNPERARKYYLNNKKNLLIKEKNRKLNEPLFRLSGNIRSLISISIKNQGYKKTSKTYDILGCSFEEFKTHLENQFTDGMTWENQGKWHLDHIYPVSRATDEEHLIKLNHYTNFQPLWAIDNIKKGNKLDYQVFRK